ncbi:MAG: MCE family protein [Nannocystis sp.]|nr:MlaD family protein [Nannocystis sp.]MBA3546667.1 MCE family protein [Nannocystis sp.]
MNTRYITLGTFVLVTLGAFGWLAMQLGLGDRGGNHYLVRTPDAAGLVEGNSVRIAGVDVGKVDRIHVEGNRAVIDIRIRKGTTVFADACAAVHIKGMLGEKYLGIDQPAEGQPLPPGAEFACVTQTVDFDNALNATRDVVYGADPLLPVVTRIAKRIDRVTSALEEDDKPAAADVPGVPGQPGVPPPARPGKLERVGDLLDNTDALLTTTLAILNENRDDLRAITQGTRALVEDPRIPRMLANGDKALEVTARRLPKLMDELEQLIARAKSGLELVDDKHRAKFDAMISDAGTALDNLRVISEEFKGLGKDLRPSLKHIGPLLEDLRTIVHRATGITETTIRQMLQIEGFRVRLSPSREARQHMRDESSADPPQQP